MNESLSLVRILIQLVIIRLAKATVRFAEDSKEMKSTPEGQMSDISSGGLAFRCNTDKNYPREGQQLIIHFSIPNSKANVSTLMMKFTRIGCVLWI